MGVMKIFGVIDAKINKADDPDQIGDLKITIPRTAP